MSRRRFFAPPSAFNFSNHTVELLSEEAKHLREVLRLKPNDEVFVFDGAGKEYRCIVSETRRDRAELQIREVVEPASPESPLKLTLAMALLKGDKFDLVVQKVTELGCFEIIPVMTRYADIQLRDQSDAIKRVARWQKIALEACKQSGRAVVPEVKPPTPFSSLLENGGAFSQRIMFSERGGEPLAAIKNRVFSNCLLLVGSEGGWSDEEIASAKNSQWDLVTLGGRVLRAETAGIAVVALMQNQFGDLR